MKAASLAVFCLAAAVFLAWTLDARSYTPGDPAASSDPLFLALGSAKEAVGDTLFLKADEYFHGGVLERRHHDESAEDVEREGILPRDDEKLPPAPSGDWIDGVNARIRATQERHLSKDKRKEMLPFFKWATDLDPHNVEAVLTTAYWLATDFGKRDEAIAVLEKGARDNPDSWEIERDLGKFYERAGNSASAAAHFAEALRKSQGNELENYERVALYYDRGQSAEASGRPADALAAYREAQRYFDTKTKAHFQSLITDKIKKLSA